MYLLIEQCMKLEQARRHLKLATRTGINNSVFQLASFECALFNLDHCTWPQKNV